MQTEVNTENLEFVRELCKEYFTMLMPEKGMYEGFYLNDVKVYNYTELFSTLKSMLNVCILAFEDQQDLTLDIKDIHYDIKTVLEFAKKLVPFEEGILLDKLRQHILTEETT